MRTVLLVSEDEALNVRLLRAMPDCSVFPAPTEEEALRTLRLTELDLILKNVAQPIGDLDGFIAKARQLRPSVVIVCILPAEGLSPDDEAALATALVTAARDAGYAGWRRAVERARGWAEP